MSGAKAIRGQGVAWTPGVGGAVSGSGCRLFNKGSATIATGHGIEAVPWSTPNSIYSGDWDDDGFLIADGDTTLTAPAAGGRYQVFVHVNIQASGTPTSGVVTSSLVCSADGLDSSIFGTYAMFKNSGSFHLINLNHVGTGTFVGGETISLSHINDLDVTIAATSVWIAFNRIG